MIGTETLSPWESSYGVIAHGNLVCLKIVLEGIFTLINVLPQSNLKFYQIEESLLYLSSLMSCISQDGCAQPDLGQPWIPGERVGEDVQWGFGRDVGIPERVHE